MKNTLSWEQLNQKVITCRKCQRLVAWRERVAIEKRRAFLDHEYWGKPVPGFGDQQARIMILGLAPGAHGSNRTGRMFTGDASGDFLFPALYEAGFASQADAFDLHDGLTMKDVYITAVCRCVPPGNKPTRQEESNCLKYLKSELQLLENLQGIVALGGIAFRSAFDLLKKEFGFPAQSRPKFSHNTLFQFPNTSIWLLGSYHPSRQNTQTGRLTREMFADVWQEVVLLLAKNQ